MDKIHNISKKLDNLQWICARITAQIIKIQNLAWSLNFCSKLDALVRMNFGIKCKRFNSIFENSQMTSYISNL